MHLKLFYFGRQIATMKKLFAAFMLLVVAAGCNKEKIYKENLNGEWQVYKYLLRNVDKTTTFAATYPDYSITFSESGSFVEYYASPDSIVVNGTFSFADNDEKLVLENEYLDLTDSTNKTYRRECTIFNLSKDHVQLKTDSSQLYMKKKTE